MGFQKRDRFLWRLRSRTLKLGERTLVYAALADGQKIVAEDVGASRVRLGDKVHLDIHGEAAHVFGPDGVGFHAG